MITDDLSAPLGQHIAAKKLFVAQKLAALKLSALKLSALKLSAHSSALPWAVAGVLGSIIVIFTLWAIVVDDHFGGEPKVVVSTEQRLAAAVKKGSESAAPSMVQSKNTNPETISAQPQSSAASPALSASTPAASVSPDARTVTIIDGSSGKRQEIQVAPAPVSTPAPAIKPQLLESTRHGLIPRIGVEGAKAVEAYARPVDRSANNKAADNKAADNTEVPRIAIVVSGLGIGTKGTADSLAKLPGQITLAFSPYNSDIGNLALQAREKGHEILLQVPMEPFDYPDNDPGPQTLLTTLTIEQNIDRLHWMMSRFKGYVGVSSYMGARFTATDRALAPILREVTKRGLLYVDDGTSSRSLAGQIAGANNMPFAKADVVLDAVPTPAEVDRALERLEAIASERGIAVGSTNALPVSIERIAKWAKQVESRGYLLVPVSAVAVKPKSS